MWKKILLGGLLAILIFNFIGSASSGGFLGLGFIGLMAIILLNKKLLKFWKPLLILLLILAVVMAGTAWRWWPEVSGAVKSVLNIQSEVAEAPAEEAVSGPATKKPTIEYFRTEGMELKTSINGIPFTVGIACDEEGNIEGMYVADETGEYLEMATQPEIAAALGETTVFSIEDDRFYDYVMLGYKTYEDLGLVITLHTCDEFFMITSDGNRVYFLNHIGAITEVGDVESFGFTNNYSFGSGRGYIWSRSIPMLKHTIITGVGADCYCAAFPQNDYAGRYTTGVFDQTIIVDKPHNMYLHMGICTGVISMLAIFVLYGAYVVQSFKLLWKRDFGVDYLTFAAAGIFFGTTAFMVTGLVDDSSVSVMPMFYTMLGTGISINLILKRRDAAAKQIA